MKNRRISVEVSRTMNLGNFNSLRLQAGISFDIEDNQPHSLAYIEAWNLLSKEISEEYDNYKKERKL